MTDGEDLSALAHRLRAGRPRPAPDFRDRLRGHLARFAPEPDRVRARIAAYAAAGSLLLLAGVVSAAGIGPLGG